MSDLETLATNLSAHEARSERRFEILNNQLTNMVATKETVMSDTPHIKNIFEPSVGASPLGAALPYMGGLGGAGAGAGAGLGAGLLGGVLGGALLGNNGILGNRNGGEGVVTPTQLTAGLAGVTEAQNNSTVLQSLGDIKASIPYAEGQVQLALSVAQADINRTITGGQAAIIAGQAGINKGVSDAIAASLASQNNINTNVLQQGAATRESIAAFGTANLTATKDSQYATAVAIAASTKEILAALNDQNVANLQRQLTVAESALLETRATSRARETEVNVTQNVTTNQNQLQAQLQTQAQAQQLVNLNALVGTLVAQHQNLQQGIINLGTMSGAAGQQTAAQTRVN